MGTHFGYIPMSFGCGAIVMSRKAIRCRLCKRATRKHHYKVCPACQPRWEDRVGRRRTKSSGLAAAYAKLMPHKWNECATCRVEPFKRRLQVVIDANGGIRGPFCFRCARVARHIWLGSNLDRWKHELGQEAECYVD